MLVKGIKIYLDEELERRFRKMAMETYGYGSGSISKAAEDPVKAIRSMLKHVNSSSSKSQSKKHLTEFPQKQTLK